jgi:hypothetical protein
MVPPFLMDHTQHHPFFVLLRRLFLWR